MSRDRRIAFLGGVAGVALASLTLWPTLLELATVWTNNPAYQYAWLVVPMVVYLLWEHHGPSGLAISPRSDLTGVPVAFAAALCWGASTLMNIDVGRQFALVLAVQGLAMSTLGWRAYWTVSPVLGLLFLMVPNGDVLLPVLRTITVRAIELFAVIAQLPHAVEGYAVSIDKNNYIVLPECAGLPYFNLAIFLGYSFGLLMYRSIFKIVALALFGGFLGVLMNILRVTAIVLIDWIRDSQMDLSDHGHLQWIALILTFGLLLYILNRLKADTEPVATQSVPRGQLGPARRFAPVLTGLTVLMVTGGVLWLIGSEPHPPRGDQAAAMPRNLLGWELASPAAAWVSDPQSSTESLSQIYKRDGRDLKVLIVTTLTPEAKLHEFQLVPRDGKTWHEQLTQKQVACVADDCLTLQHVTWMARETGEVRHVYFAYSMGDFTTISKFSLRASHGWHRLSRRDDRPLSIAFAANDPPPSADEIAGAFRVLQTSLDNAHRD